MCGVKRKCFVEFPRVTGFLAGQSAEINAEYRELVLKLETEGRLSMPFGEKLKGEDLFAIRVINAGNVRGARRTPSTEFTDTKRKPRQFPRRNSNRRAEWPRR